MHVFLFYGFVFKEDPEKHTIAHAERMRLHCEPSLSWRDYVGTFEAVFAPDVRTAAELMRKQIRMRLYGSTSLDGLCFRMTISGELRQPANTGWLVDQVLDGEFKVVNDAQAQPASVAG